MLLFDGVDFLGVVFGLGFAYPLALMLLPRPVRSPLVLALTALALSLGGLTLWLMLLALLGGLGRGAALAGPAVTFGVALAWILRTQALYPDYPLDAHEGAGEVERSEGEVAPRHPLALGALLITGGMALLVAFNAIYWPFYDDDAVSIYAYQSRQVYQTGDLPTGAGLYEAYPMLLPLSHVYGYLLAGSVNEYLAGVAVAALAAGVFGAAVALGHALYDTPTGIGAGLLLALTPMVARWGSSGYTDLPAAFFVTLAALFGWWLRQQGTVRAALLLGIMGGLAAWTKNSALIVAASVGAWAIYLTLRDPARVPRGRVLWVALGGALAAGPWYLRNLIAFGYLVPDTAWTDQAQRTAANLVPFLAAPGDYWLPGVAYTAGLAWALFSAGRGLLRRDEAMHDDIANNEGDRAALVLLLVLPFGVAWWWSVSYDSRFLLVILPILAVMGARVTLLAWSTVWRMRGRAAPALAPAVQIALVVVLAGAALPAARKAVDFKGDLVRDPLMDDQRRHELTLGPVYNVAQYLRALPAEGRILTDTYFLPFHAMQAGRTEVIVGGLPDRARLADYDYIVISAGRGLYALVEAGDVDLLTTIEGFRVYRVRYRAE